MKNRWRRLELMMADNFVGTAAGLTGLSLLLACGLWLVSAPDDRLGIVGLGLTAYGVIITIFVFAMTLSGYARERSTMQAVGAREFSRKIESNGRRWGEGPLPDGEESKVREELMTVLDPPGELEDELVLWLIDKGPADPAQKGKSSGAVVAVTKRLYFLHVISGGAGGAQVINLATGKRLPPKQG